LHAAEDDLERGPEPDKRKMRAEQKERLDEIAPKATAGPLYDSNAVYLSRLKPPGFGFNP
jgi:hypothetical protein